MPKRKNFKPREALVPERFKEARMARGMTASDLADKVGRSRQAISKYELGLIEPTAEVIYSLSNALDVPISFFYKPLSAPANRGTTYFRSLKTNAARAKEMLLTKSEWATQIAHILSEDIVFPQFVFPTLPIQFDSRDDLALDEIEEITLSIRRQWKLGEAPISNMARLLESHGFIIAAAKTGLKETDACSAMVNGRPFIFLDTEKECAVRTRFNLAHEFGHLILHGSINQSDLENKQLLERIEKEANQFASSFLLPQSSFLLDIYSTSLQAFLPLKLKWKVSIQAMVYRCKELGIFNENQMIYIQKQTSAKRWRHNEPYDDEWKCEQPVVLRKAMQMLLDRGDYTKEQFLSLFRLNASDVEEICSLPKGFLSPNENSQANTIPVDFINKARA